jgi:sigma-B regulation protein RsbU (phosphoserine phosphatase)
VLKPWENARLLHTLKSQIEKGQIKRTELRREREEVEEARAVGAALLPQSIPEVTGLEIATTSQPLRTLGGDYFDVLDLGNGKLGICIADVIGKGVPAALLMSNVQATVRTLATESMPPSGLVARLNQSVHRNTTPGKFVTFCYCVVDRDARQVTYTDAGHCAPILVRASGEVVRLNAGGAVLGVFPKWDYEQATVSLEPGDRLVLFTDGVTEAANARDEEFGEERLAQLISALRDRGANELKNRILKSVSTFTAGGAQDDATLVVVAVS